MNPISAARLSSHSQLFSSMLFCVFLSFISLSTVLLHVLCFPLFHLSLNCSSPCSSLFSYLLSLSTVLLHAVLCFPLFHLTLHCSSPCCSLFLFHLSLNCSPPCCSLFLFHLSQLFFSMLFSVVLSFISLSTVLLHVLLCFSFISLNCSSPCCSLLSYLSSHSQLFFSMFFSVFLSFISLSTVLLHVLLCFPIFHLTLNCSSPSLLCFPIFHLTLNCSSPCSSLFSYLSSHSQLFFSKFFFVFLSFISLSTVLLHVLLCFHIFHLTLNCSSPSLLCFPIFHLTLNCSSPCSSLFSYLSSHSQLFFSKFFFVFLSFISLNCSSPCSSPFSSLSLSLWHPVIAILMIVRGSLLKTCPGHLHHHLVMIASMSSSLHLLRRSSLEILCGHNSLKILHRHVVWKEWSLVKSVGRWQHPTLFNNWLIRSWNHLNILFS